MLREPETAIDWGGLVGMVFLLATKNTPPKTNMEPEKDGFQKESPFSGVHFQVPCFRGSDQIWWAKITRFFHLQITMFFCLPRFFFGVESRPNKKNTVFFWAWGPFGGNKCFFQWKEYHAVIFFKQTSKKEKTWLVGGFNPLETY